MKREKEMSSKEKSQLHYTTAVDDSSRTRRPDDVKGNNSRQFPSQTNRATIPRSDPLHDSRLERACKSSFTRFGSRGRREELLNPLPPLGRSRNSSSTIPSAEISNLPATQAPVPDSKSDTKFVSDSNRDSRIAMHSNACEQKNNELRFSPPPVTHPPPPIPFRIRKPYPLLNTSTQRLNATPPIDPGRTSIRSLSVPTDVSLSNIPIPRTTNVVANRERLRQDLTFDDLVRNILHHRMFPLIFKGVYETANGSSPVILNRRSDESVRRTSRESEQIAVTARHDGMKAATKNIEPIDTFFAAINAAFNSLQSAEQPPIPAPLHSMISACEQAPIQSRTVNSDASSNPSQQWENRNNHNATNNSNDHSVIRPKLSDGSRQKLEQWFNEHFENPYPTDSEKRDLARACGLQLNQVSETIVGQV